MVFFIQLHRRNSSFESIFVRVLFFYRVILEKQRIFTAHEKVSTVMRAGDTLLANLEINVLLSDFATQIPDFNVLTGVHQ